MKLGRLAAVATTLDAAAERCPAERSASLALLVPTLTELGRERAARAAIAAIGADGSAPADVKKAAADASRALDARAKAIASADTAAIDALLVRAATAAAALDAAQARALYLEAWSKGSSDGRALYGAARATAPGAEATRLYDRAVEELESAMRSKVTFEPASSRVGGGRWSSDGLVVVGGGKLIDPFGAAMRDLGDAITLSHHGKHLAYRGSDHAIHACDLPGCTRDVVVVGAPNVGDVVFTPDDASLIVTATEAITTWDVAARKVTRTFPQGAVAIPATLSPDGGTIAKLASNPNALQILDGKTGVVRASIRTTITPTVLQTPADLSDDGSALLLGCSLHDAKTGALRKAFGNVDRCQFVPGGKWVLIRAGGKSRTYEVATGREKAAFGDHSVQITSVPGKLLATSGATVRLFDAESGAETFETDAPGETIRSAQLEGGFITVTTMKGALIVYDLRTRAEVRRFSVDGHVLSGTVSPSGRFLAATLTQATFGPAVAIVWEIATGKTIARLGTMRDEIVGPAISQDGTRIALTSSKDTTLLDLRDGTVRRLPAKASGGGGAVAFSPDGELLATGEAMWPTVLDLASGTKQPAMPMRSFKVQRGKSEISIRNDVPWLGIASVTAEGGGFHNGASRSGEHIAWGYGSELVVYQTNRGTLTELKGHSGERGIYGVAFSREGRTLVSVDDAGARVWAIEDGRQLATFDSPDRLTGWALSDDGKQLALVTARSRVRVVDVARGTELARVERPNAKLYRPSFSPSGRALVFPSGDRATLWRVGTSELSTLEPTETGAVLRSSSGAYESFGSPNAGGSCRIGDWEYPSELCAARTRNQPGLLTSTLAP